MYSATVTMGIKGLLQALASITDRVHVSEFAGKTVAVVEGVESTLGAAAKQHLASLGKYAVGVMLPCAVGPDGGGEPTFDPRGAMFILHNAPRRCDCRTNLDACLAEGSVRTFFRWMQPVHDGQGIHTMEILVASHTDEMKSDFGAQVGDFAEAGKKTMMAALTKVVKADQIRTIVTMGGEAAVHVLDAVGKAFNKDAADLSSEFLSAMQAAALYLGIAEPSGFMLKDGGGFTAFYDDSADERAAILLSIAHAGQVGKGAAYYSVLNTTNALAGGVLAALLLVAKHWKDRKAAEEGVADVLERLRETTSKAFTAEEFRESQATKGASAAPAGVAGLGGAQGPL